MKIIKQSKNIWRGIPILFMLTDILIKLIVFSFLSIIGFKKTNDLYM